MLDILRRIVQDINATRDLSEALNLIVVEVKAAIHTDVCSVYMTDHTRGEHVLMATDGLRPGAVGKVRLKLGHGLTGLVATRAEPVNVDNAPAHPAFRYVAATGEAPFRGFIGVPIVRRRKVFGVLVAQQREQRKYTADEESFLVTLAAQLAGCINQAEIRQALERLDDDALSGTLFLEGVASARGLAIGEAVVVFPATALNQVPDKDIDDPEAEASRFRQAVAAELAELQRLSERMRLLLAAGDRALFDAYALLLSSDSLVNGTLERIGAGNWAPGALRATVLEYANIFAEMDDPYLRERAADILDLGQRLLDRLQEEQVVNRHYPDHTILMGEEISVSQLLDVPPEKLKGLVSVRGTGASHVALLGARAGGSGGVRRQQPAAGPFERPRGGGGRLHGAGLHPAQPGAAPGISEADRRGGRVVARLAAPARFAGRDAGRASSGTACQFRPVRRHRRRPQQRGAGGGAVSLGAAFLPARPLPRRGRADRHLHPGAADHGAASGGAADLGCGRRQAVAVFSHQ